MSLKINLLGEVSFWVDGKAMPPLRSRTATALVVYLAYHPQPFSREFLATFFWPDKTQEHAATNLRSTLRLLRPDFEPYITIARKEVQFNQTADFFIDAVDLEQRLNQLQTFSPSPTQVDPQLGRALANLLATDQEIFMPGFYVNNSPKFEQWVFSNRDQLQQKMENSLQQVVELWVKKAGYETALPVAKRLVQLDPLNEKTGRLLMEIQWRSGQRNDALREYKSLASRLSAELDILPAEETIKLRSRIRAQQALPITHLPEQTTPFIGREAELVSLYNQLMLPTCRFLTIFGPGGVGKTRLLIALGELLCNKFPGPFPEGIFYIPLVQLSSARFLTLSLVSGLGLTLFGEGTPEEELLNHVAGKELILLLDNMEHL
ncbi:MAG: BTAD domain-containing putative transcriptional regulator, partial [Chloroflexota bacterium]